MLCCSAKALSKYTDMVDSVSRELLNKLAEATDAARLALKQVRAGTVGPAVCPLLVCMSSS